MKRVISLVLALMLVLSLSCTAFAFVPPNEERPHTAISPDCVDMNGDCVCDYQNCDKSMHGFGSDCKCDKCGTTIHTYGNDCVCDKCGTANHVMGDDCVCDKCNQVVHNFNGDSTCDVCKMTCATHEYVNGYCTVCGSKQPTVIYNLIVDGNPKTGDIIMTWVAVMGLAAAALFVVTKSYRKAR